jgi:hypothetical protein
MTMALRRVNAHGRSRRRRTGAWIAVAGLVTAVVASPGRAADLSDLVKNVVDGRLGSDERTAAPRPTREEVAQNWDAFLTVVIKRAGRDAPPGALRDELLAVLIEERHLVVSMLTDVTVDAPDLMRSMFETSWEQLSPLLHRIAADLPPRAARRYRQFVEAGELMRAAERLGVARELAGSPESLRKLARILLGDSEQDLLRYDTDVDPELRRIFGFGEPLDPPAQSPLLGPGAPAPGAGGGGLVDPLSKLADWLLPVAWASEFDGERPALVARLNTWIPGQRQEVRDYVPLVHDMLRLTAEEAVGEDIQTGDIAVARVYPDLLIATAWQESCWRQFVRRENGVQPLVGPAGSVGLMQINGKVWRGIYDPAGLEGDIGYNGRAGAEILHHYLRDLALPSGEHLAPGGVDNLARAAYAAYNGGPRHLSRYRKEKTSAHLQVVDRAFWRKYQAVQAREAASMLTCFPTAS